MKFEIYRTDGQEWRWRLRSANGETIASGEGYKRKRDCLHVVMLIQDLAKSARVEVLSEK